MNIYKPQLSNKVKDLNIDWNSAGAQFFFSFTLEETCQHLNHFVTHQKWHYLSEEFF